MRRRFSIAWMNLFICLTLAAIAMPADAVWQWMRGSALVDFKESDWVMLKATARGVLNDKPDGEQVNWTNPDTGNRGSIIALETFSSDGKRCRRAAMRNLSSNGREDKAAYNLCQQTDGDWIFVPDSARRTSPPAPQS